MSEYTDRKKLLDRLDQLKEKADELARQVDRRDNNKGSKNGI